MARGRVAARHRRPPLPARRILARGDVHTADVGAARHGEHCSTSPPTAPAGCCSPLPPVPGSPGSPTRRPRLAAPAGPPDPNFQFGRWLVTAWADSCGNRHRRMFCDSSVAFLRLQTEDSRCNGCSIKSVSERLGRSEKKKNV